MSENGNTDDTVVPRDGVFTSSLQPTVEGTPAQYMPAEPAIPAEPLQPLQPAQYMPAERVEGTPLQPMQAGERIEAPLAPMEAGETIEGRQLGTMQAGETIEGRQLGTTGSPETPRYLEDSEPGQTEPRFYKSTGPDAAEPRAYKSTGPDDAEPGAYKSTGPDDAQPRALESTGPDSKPAMLDREAAQKPSGDGGDNPPGGSSDNPPPSSGNGNPPSSGDNPPSGSDDPPTTKTGSGSGSVSVDTDKLSQAIPGLDGIMRQMYAIGNGTANALNGYQLDRGDSYGEAYTTTANPISSQILEALSNAGSVFGDTAEGATLMVHNYNVTEDNAAESASGLLARSED